LEKQDKSTDKLTDKAFSRLLVTSVVGILLCIVCLCSATWAWFSTDIKSPENKIETGKGLMTVTVTKEDDNTFAFEEGKEQSWEIGEYTVTLFLPANSGSGYCVIVANGKEYLSPYIHKDDAPKSIQFTLKLNEQTKVTVKTHRGIYSKTADVAESGVLEIPNA